MNYRQFGNTGLQLSEIGFGSWAIGGKSFGAVSKRDALNALAKAEEMGCNFVDTAAVYGEAEAILGEFLPTRRHKWILASKFSSSTGDLRTTLESQLQRLNTDYIDFYQIHWTPTTPELYEQLYQLRAEGKVRYVGVSLNNATDIDYVIEKTRIDGFQVPLLLLDPFPFLRRQEKIRASGLGVIARSCLQQGFLSGKYTNTTTFVDPDDQRSRLSAAQIAAVLQQVAQFHFLATPSRLLSHAAIRYPLSFPEVASVIVSTKTAAQAIGTFLTLTTPTLSAEELQQIAAVQQQLGLLDVPLKVRVREMLSAVKRKLR